MRRSRRDDTEENEKCMAKRSDDAEGGRKGLQLRATHDGCFCMRLSHTVMLTCQQWHVLGRHGSGYRIAHGGVECTPESNLRAGIELVHWHSCIRATRVWGIGPCRNGCLNAIGLDHAKVMIHAGRCKEMQGDAGRCKGMIHAQGGQWPTGGWRLMCSRGICSRGM